MSTQITSVYGIAGPVDFLDVKVDQDNRLFVDPSRIRGAASRRHAYAQSAYTQLTSHFDEILRCIRSSSPADRLRGERLMQRYKEPNETRLGMSANNPQGHGAAEELGTHIWNALLRNPLCQARVAILKRIEDIPIFVEGIDADITSDLTTRIIGPALARFTTRMVQKHPEFTSNAVVAPHDFVTWSPSNLQWVTRTFHLPVAHGRPLLLVPERWTGPRLLMYYGQYYQRPLLGEIQRERTTWTSGPKGPRALRPTKTSLKDTAQFKPSRGTCVEQTLRIAQNGVDLVEQYRVDADERATASVAAQIAKRLAE